MDEIVLPRSAQANPENVGAGICHARAEVVQFIVGEVTVGRALGTNDFYPWRDFLETHGHVGGNASVAPI
jgi:hypothetical protein